MSAIELKNLRKYFGETKAVDDISFEVEKGEIFGFLGPNGAGKTTTIRCMMDFIRPTGGSINILGKDAQKDSVDLKKRVGYLSGMVNLYNSWNGKTHVNFLEQLDGGKGLAKTLSERLDFNLGLKTRRLSLGNRQKLGLIIALMSKPDVLILDEPTIALDPLLQNIVYELLEELSRKGVTIFMSSHNLHEVERLCSRVGIIKGGKMVAIERVAELREKRLYIVTVYFSRKVSKGRIVSKGVEIEKELSNGFVLSVKGDVRPLLNKLGRFPVADIEVKHASLEDIFMEFYRK